MSERCLYLAVGEEASRGAKESVAVGFIPLLNAAIPQIEFEEKKRKEFRGEESVKGETAVLRTGRRWNGSIEAPFFTESGGSKGIIGTLIKHFFGRAVTAQAGATGQYSHMMYPVSDPFSAVNLGTKAVTLNLNINEGAIVRNWPFAGGRVKSLSFEQEVGEALKIKAELTGQFRGASEAATPSPVFAEENLRCGHTGLKVYTGAITRTGTAPDFTDFITTAATRIIPDKISVKLENGIDDAARLSGFDYPDKTRMGQFKASVEMTIDWEDPASGFSSVAEFNAWVAAGGETNFLLHWDTGTQAGTGANHGLYIDLPRVRRAGGSPDYAHDKDPMITLKYEGLYDATSAKYIAGVLLRNTAPAA